jgi:hypothetical protein
LKEGKAGEKEKQTRANSLNRVWISGVAAMWNCEAGQSQMVEKAFEWEA